MVLSDSDIFLSTNPPKFNSVYSFIHTYIHLSIHFYSFLSICQSSYTFRGARCSSVVRALAHGAMGRRFDPSCWTHWAISRVKPVLLDLCNKARSMCYPVCGMMHIKEPLLLIGKSSLVVTAGFLSRYLSEPLRYVWRDITVNKMCWVRH